MCMSRITFLVWKGKGRVAVGVEVVSIWHCIEASDAIQYSVPSEFSLPPPPSQLGAVPFGCDDVRGTSFLCGGTNLLVTSPSCDHTRQPACDTLEAFIIFAIPDERGDLPVINTEPQKSSVSHL